MLTKEDTRTEFEKRYWDFAKTQIPADAELKSICEVNTIVECIGIFYRIPGKDSNNYKHVLTKYGRLECEIKGIDLKEGDQE